jgi:hypothetical protein
MLLPCNHPATLLPSWLQGVDKTSFFPPFFFSSSLLFLAPFSIHPTQHYAASISPPPRQPINLHIDNMKFTSPLLTTMAVAVSGELLSLPVVPLNTF